ncbi:MAG: PilZ domain-containing protein [Firmicutes bacterium]|nr:PilZ domain-containing protein [Bacillota bacterium]
MREPLVIGERIWLRLLSEPEPVTYVSRVEDVSETSVAIQRPMVQRQPIALPRGTGLELEVRRSKPPGEGVYRAVTEVVGATVDPLPLVFLRMPDQWHRIQMRHYVRVPAFLAVAVRPQTPDEAEWLEGKTVNVSGGGCQVVLPESLDRDQPVEIVLSLPSRDVRATGAVRRMEKAEDGTGWRLAIEFTDISDKDRRHVIRFAFQRQIELRKKGMA